jgi:hypothetical protein
MQGEDRDSMAGPRTSSRILKPRYSILDLGLATVAIGLVAFVSAWRFKAQLAEVTFQNSLPSVVAAREKLIPDSEAYKGQYQFGPNWFTYNIPVWEAVLSPYRGKPDVHYLEVGLYEGRSALWVLENILTHPSARLTGIDPFLGPYKEKFFANIEKSGSKEKVTAITGYSQVALRSLPLNSFDIVYIDGSHAEDDVLEDAVLCSRLLRDGGILIFDDYRWAGCFVSGTCDSPTDFPKAAIDRFIQCFDKKFDVIHNSYQIILKKKGTGVARQG